MKSKSKKTAAKKTAAKKTSAKEPLANQTTAKNKTAVKKPATKTSAKPTANQTSAKQSLAKLPAAKKPPAKQSLAGQAAPPASFAVAADPEVRFPGRLEIATQEGAVIEELPTDPLLAGTQFAVLLRADERRAYLYVAHRTYPDQLTAVLVFAESARLPKGDLRLPQHGAWLWCPTAGTVFVLASPRLLTFDEIVKLLDDRSPPPVKGGDD